MREFLKFTGFDPTAATRPRQPRNRAGIFAPWLRRLSASLNGCGTNLRDGSTSLNPAATSPGGRFPSPNPRVTSLNDGSPNRRETTPPTSGATAPAGRSVLFPPLSTV